MELDLLVIGSGPGGQRAAIQAAKLGKRVAVAERRNRLGGVSRRGGQLERMQLPVPQQQEIGKGAPGVHGEQGR